MHLYRAWEQLAHPRLCRSWPGQPAGVPALGPGAPEATPAASLTGTMRLQGAPPKPPADRNKGVVDMLPIKHSQSLSAQRACAPV